MVIEITSSWLMWLHELNFAGIDLYMILTHIIWKCEKKKKKKKKKMKSDKSTFFIGLA